MSNTGIGVERIKLPDRKRIVKEIQSDRTICENWILRYQNKDPNACGFLLQAHERLIRHFVLKCVNQWSRDWEDCMQEGRLGAMHAYSLYVPDSAVPSTYIGIWIRAYVITYQINKGQGVRIPKQHYSRKKLQRARCSLRRPRTKLFSELPDIANDNVVLAFQDVLIDQTALPDEQLDKRRLETNIPQLTQWFLGRLRQTEITVLRYRFSDNPETLLTIGKYLRVTRSRVGQIESEALRKCRREACHMILRAQAIQESRREIVTMLRRTDAFELSVQKHVHALDVEESNMEQPDGDLEDYE